jgi:hypothetical protein
MQDIEVRSRVPRVDPALPAAAGRDERSLPAATRLHDDAKILLFH